jgi:nicotinate-nucleotide adenylyltransferase
LKLGVFGGTFNPIHYGHLINAQVIFEDFILDKMIFVPSKAPVHKEFMNGATGEDRYHMIEYAIEGNSNFEVSRIELDRDTPSYTIFTINELIDAYRESVFYLVIGIDSYNEFQTWKDYRDILKRVSLIVLKRPDSRIVNVEIQKISDNIFFANNPPIAISSSKVRENIKEGKSIRYLVPPKVERYIIDKGLYKN